MKYFSHFLYRWRSAPVPYHQSVKRGEQTGPGNEFGNWGPKMGDAAIALVTKIHSVQIAVEQLNGDIRALNSSLAEMADSVDKCLARSPPKALILRDEAARARTSPASRKYLATPFKRIGDRIFGQH